jgi:hypothetical protein
MWLFADYCRAGGADGAYTERLSAVRRCGWWEPPMNVRESPKELNRVRNDIAVALRLEHEREAQPAPDSLTVLLKLATRVRDAEREKAFAQVDVRIAELMEAAGRRCRP